MSLLKKFRKKAGENSRQGDQEELTRTESLQCIPIRSSLVEWSVVEDEDILLEYPITMKPFFLSLAKRFKKDQELRLTKKLQLDVTGSRVWRMLDGNHNVKTIIKRVAADTGLTTREAEIAVTTFLRELGRRGIIFVHQPSAKKRN